jgi:hypothetical protein
MATIAERVTRGAEFLDEHDPDWWKNDVPNAIDLGQLDLADGSSCVLGQRCPLEVTFDEDKYGAYLSNLVHGQDVLPGVLEIWAGEMGFNTPPGTGAAHYGQLTAAWRKLIAARRAGEPR